MAYNDYNWASVSGNTLASTNWVGQWSNFPPQWNSASLSAGTIGNAFDDDLSTYYNVRCTASLDNRGGVESITSSTFSSTDIDSVVAKMGYAFYNRTRDLLHTYLIEAYYSGGWNTVASGNMTGGNGGVQTLTSSSLGLTGVTGIRIKLRHEADLNGSSPYWLETRLYELQALGPRLPMWVRDSGTWKKVKEIWVMNDGSWKLMKSMSVMESSSWK